LALYRGFLSDPPRALALIERRWPGHRPPVTQAASRLLTGTAAVEDVGVVLSELNSGYIRPVIESLWVDQLDGRRAVVEDADLEIVKGASPFNRHDFVGRQATLGRLYMRAGRLDEAEAIVADLADRFGLREDVRALAGKLDLQRGRVTRRAIGHIGRWAGRGLKRRMRAAARPR
jgi:hypothetical protein